MLLKILALSFLLSASAYATVSVVRYPSGTPVQVCQASDSNPSCGGGSSSGTNWNQIGGIQATVNVSGFNWEDLKGINTSTINWQGITFNNLGINWDSVINIGTVPWGTGSGNVGIGTVSRIPVYIGSTTIGSPYNNVMDSNGNVGIGTTVPSGALDVGSGSICLGHTCNATWPSGSSQWVTVNTNDVYLPNNGNVGIGTNTPGTSLDVRGTVTIGDISGHLSAIKEVTYGINILELQPDPVNAIDSSLAIYTFQNLPDGISFASQNNDGSLLEGIQFRAGLSGIMLDTSGGPTVTALNGAPVNTLDDGTGNMTVTGLLTTTSFNMPTGAASGYVLTVDGSGFGTWQAPSGGSNYVDSNMRY